jgi:hypothetical protein
MPEPGMYFGAGGIHEDAIFEPTAIFDVLVF